VDTLRADHLGAYGYGRPTSPQVDALAADGVVFEAAVAQSSWTRPTVASLLTGLHPQVHGANGRDDALAPELPRLSTTLRDAGYRTAAFFTNGNAGPNFGFAEGFDDVEYFRERKTARIHVPAEEVTDAVIGWLDRRPAGAPFLLWVHVSDPHAPYDPPEPFRGRFGAGHLPPEAGSIQELYRAGGGDRPATPREELIDLYDGEIATTDRALGRLVRRLGAEGLLDETVVVFVADHGEAFQEHGRWQHGNDLHQEQIHVPLIVRLPGARRAGLRVADRVQQIDVFPTLLDLLDLPVPEGVQGRSLLPLLAGGGGDGPPVYSYLAKDGMELSAVIAGHLKLIRDVVYDRERPPRHLYDLADDPEERFDRWSDEDVAGGYLESLLLRADLRWSARAPRVRGDLDRELVERLQALGYLR
ncbi:MAG TPA: sulfatase, partial [Thermoanaerobaculia bacterium]|nr:sulfatase [Thermoanaerobaculia bacterium]